MNRILLTAAVIACSASFARAGSAIVAAQIKAPTYFNLFWDSNWDADNPGMTMTQINAYTQALTLSSYFGGLGEYGIAGAAFGGGMKVLPVCGANPPARPSAAEVLAFVKCESLLPPIKGSSAVINVFLPNHVLQRDDAGAIPDFVGITKGVIEACRGQYGSYHSLTGNFSPLGGPYYTAIFADDSCVTGLPMLLTNLTHEMVEAATDPTAALSVVLAAGGGEVGDKCPSTTTAFGVPNSFSAPGVPVSAGLVSGYFSNRSGACLTGFTSGVTPSVNLQFSWPNNLAVGAPTLTITGSGFGTLPPGLATWSGNTPTPVALPASLSLPYLAVVDGNFGGVWTAGDELTSGGNIPLSIQSWTNTAITLNGFGAGFGSGGVVVKPGDNLSVIVCNPVSGMCGTAAMKVPQPSPPVIASVTPAVAPEAGGTFVTIAGSGFTTMNDVEVEDRKSVV